MPADCCPECESIRIVEKSGGFRGTRQHPEDWVCERCRHHFDDPVETEPAGGPNGTGNSPTVERLLKHDGDIRGGSRND